MEDMKLLVVPRFHIRNQEMFTKIAPWRIYRQNCERILRTQNQILNEMRAFQKAMKIDDNMFADSGADGNSLDGE